MGSISIPSDFCEFLVSFTDSYWVPIGWTVAVLIFAHFLSWFDLPVSRPSFDEFHWILLIVWVLFYFPGWLFHVSFFTWYFFLLSLDWFLSEVTKFFFRNLTGWTAAITGNTSIRKTVRKPSVIIEWTHRYHRQSLSSQSSSSAWITFSVVHRVVITRTGPHSIIQWFDLVLWSASLTQRSVRVKHLKKNRSFLSRALISSTIPFASRPLPVSGTFQ